MAEDRSWMYKRVVNGYISDEYLKGVKRFMSHAVSKLQGQAEKRVRCPCTKCKNGQLHDKRIVQMHLCNKGFTENYHVWSRHGESGADTSETPEGSIDNEMNEGGNAYGESDHIDEMVLDAAGPNFCQNIEEPPNAEAASFFDMLDAADKPLWEKCGKHSQLSAVSRLLTIKSDHNMSVACFDELVKVMKEMLPPDANLPGSFYKCKKVVEALGMPVQKIDVCKNDCMLYYKEHANKRKCITCNEPRYIEGLELPENKKGTPQKVLRYLPIIPRLQRLYMSRGTATHMTYHKDGLESERCNNESRKKKLTHPAESEAWKHIDSKYPNFAKEPRNVRLGLSTDGFTPFNQTATPYSCWPVFVVPYNLPPALCMKAHNIFLTMVIPGPTHPGKNIDVFFHPLIDELLQLWTEGVVTYDRSKNQNFVMRAALMGTVSDFPAYGMLCGWSTHGKLACPICMEDTKSFWLKVGGKPCWFDCHRRFLPKGHPFRRAKDKFIQNKEEKDGPPIHRSSSEVYDCVKSLPQITFGTKAGNQEIEGFGKEHNWVKRSIFWELPYWRELLVRHNLDVMHIEKNVFDNIWNTLMDIPKRTKDNVKARFDLANICNRKELHMQQKSIGRWVKPKACYSLDKAQKKLVLQWVKNLKFPDGYASNLARGVDINRGKIIGMKSHDCHVFMERLLPVAFRDFLPKHIWKCLAELSYFFRQLCAKEVDIEQMKHLQKEVPVIVCKLEQIFPPGFFDCMEHLVVHLAYEALIGGPVAYRWMYVFERYVSLVKY